MSRQGFILQASIRLSAGLPVLLLYGRLQEGETFLVRDDRQRACFYVRTADGEAVSKLAGPHAKLMKTSRQNLAGEPVSRIELSTPVSTASLGHRLHAAGLVTYEADLNMVMRFLVDRGIRSSIEIHGTARRGRPAEEGVDLVFDNPELSPGSVLPQLRSLVLRLHQSQDGTLGAAALADQHGEVVLQQGGPANTDATCFPDERSLLAALIQRLVTKDPDLIVGYHLLTEDVPLLREAARRCRMSLPLARGPGDLQFQPGNGRSQGPRAVLSGRILLDVAPLWRQLKGAGHEDPSFASESLASEVRSLAQLIESQGLLDVAMQRSRLTGLPLDRATASVAAFDFLYLIELGRRGYVAPTFQRPQEPGEPIVGGLIIPPQPGLHRNVLVFDFRSLYPSVIRTFQIDPLGLLSTGASPETEADPIIAPSGARFRRQRGILTVILDQLLPLRSAARSQGHEAQSQAIKLLMNSLYGVLGSPACRFHRPELASAVTSFGRALLTFSQAKIESYGHRVLYGDTDSLFVLANLDDSADEQALRALGQQLTTRLNTELATHIEQTWRVESQVELALQSVYRRLLLHRQRGRDKGAAKRYAGLVLKNGQSRVNLVGLEAVRRDSSELCRSVQQRLYTMLFAESPPSEIATYLQRTIAELLSGKLDGMLVYRKTLRRDPSDYVAKGAPHVVIAARHGLLLGHVVPYVVTTAGPEHPDHRQHPLDYQHYLEKQVRSVAEPILSHYGLSFARIHDGNPQLRLL
jgi:DNA polymerase-2